MAPDPGYVAGAQTASNLATADANRNNSVTPFGSSMWGQTPDGRWTQVQQFSDPVSNLYGGMYDVAGKLQPVGENLAGQANSATTQPLNFGGVNQDYLKKGPQALVSEASDAYYNKAKSFLDPDWDQKRTVLENQLSRQGIPLGSDAYNNSFKQFDNSRTQAYDAARSGAVGQGITGSNAMFNMALQGQKQNIDQQTLAQQNPMKLLSMIYGGTA